MRAPILEEFMEDARMLEALQQDDKKHKATFRKTLEIDYLNKAGVNWDRLLFMVDDEHKKQIDAVKTQDNFDKLYKKFYDLSCLALVIMGDMRHCCAILDYHIEKITYSNYICPCCGKAIGDDDLDKIRIDYDDHKLLENFYCEFYEQCQKHLARLKKIGREQKFDLCSWQKDIESLGARQRVEELEGESTRVSETFKDRDDRKAAENQRTAVEIAREFIKRKRAEGFKFAGEE